MNETLAERVSHHLYGVTGAQVQAIYAEIAALEAENIRLREALQEAEAYMRRTVAASESRTYRRVLDALLGHPADCPICGSPNCRCNE